MTTFATIIKTATAALLLSGGAALANQDYCPITGQWQPPGTPCVANPPPEVDTPEEWNVWNNNLTQTINNNLASIGVGIGQGGNATGGNSSADSTSNSNSNATGGSSTSNSNATGGAGGSSTSNATGGAGGSSVATNGNQTTNVDASSRTTIRQAANVANSIQLPGYGGQNCFGDTNPSGGFTANVTWLGGSASAGSSKASNVCAVAALAGNAAAIGYLQRMDPNVPRAITVMQPTGRVICPANHPIYVEGKGCK